MEGSYTLTQLRDRLGPVFRENRVRKAVLFGSYVKGQATADSDVDILVDSGLPGMAFFGLLEDVCSSLDCAVDLIDTRAVIPGSAIARAIERTGLVIYEQ